jgi:peptide/nickel transport system permease protein
MSSTSAIDLSIGDPAGGPARANASERRSGGLRRFAPRWSPRLVIGLTVSSVFILWAIIGPFVVSNPTSISTYSLVHPFAHGYILGSTQAGQDVFAQVAWGLRGTLIIGFSVGVIVTVLSALFGVVGAYVGGIVDDTFALFTNVMLVIPGLPLVIVISNYVPPSQRGVFLIAFVLALTGWAAPARVLRGVTLSVRSRDYVVAAQTGGESSWRVLAVEVLPNLLPVLASQFIFAIIFAILGEAGLAFLGLGADGTYTLGNILYTANQDLALTQGAWWWFIPPGLVIALFGASLSLINFSIDEVINPKLRDVAVVNRRRWRLKLRRAVRPEEGTAP